MNVGFGNRIVHHSVREDFGHLLRAALHGTPVYAALGPVYETDPAAALLAPFYRSAKEAGLDPDLMVSTELAPHPFLAKAYMLREQAVADWDREAVDADWTKVEDWTRAGLVLEIASRRGICFRGGSKEHVKWKLRGTVTGRFGADGGFNPLVIPKEKRSQIIPSGPNRSIVVFDFRAMDLCSMIALCPGLAERYAGARDLHQRTAEIMGLDRDVAKREIFVYAYGGNSRHTSDFIVRIPEIRQYIRGDSHGIATANARMIQKTSADAFKAALSRALPLLTSDDCLPVFTVHDEVALDVLNETLGGLWDVAKALQDGASERIGVPYTVDMKTGRNYAEAKA
jgi:hypothetical protein